MFHPIKHYHKIPYPATRSARATAAGSLAATVTKARAGPSGSVPSKYRLVRLINAADIAAAQFNERVKFLGAAPENGTILFKQSIMLPDPRISLYRGRKQREKRA